MASHEGEGPARSTVRVAAFAGTFVFLAGFVWLWWHGVPVLYRGVNGIGEPDRLKAITDTRTALLAGLAAIGALATFALNIRAQRFTVAGLRLTQENLRLTERNQEETFRLAQRGHQTDRYAKAIEQLGSETVDVRLGGIYAVEQLARDFTESHDQDTVVEVLSAFARLHSDPLYRLRHELGRPPTGDDDNAEPAEERTAEDRKHRDLILRNLERERAGQYVSVNLLPIDVHAAITVLGRLPVREGGKRGDLGGATLTRANFTYAKLQGLSLGADLSSSLFFGADLENAVLAGAKLHHANFFRANLTGTMWTLADLTGAVLDGANLSDADLSQADGLTQDQVEKARGNAATKLPDGVHHPATWTS